MGIFKAIGTSLSGSLGDQWKEIITAPEFSEYQILAPGYLKTNSGKSSNSHISEGVITKGSIIYIPENTAMIVYSQSGIEEIITTPVCYKYEN